MEHFAGLDVSVKDTSVCIVDDTGRIVHEVKVPSEPESLLAVLKIGAYRFKRIGLEAGPLSQWLFSALAEAGLPAICVATRHMRAALQAQINKTDRNDARGIAQMMRAGLFRPVHVKTIRSQKLRMLLTHRKLLQSKAIAIENDLRATLRNFGLKVGMVGTVKFEGRIKELVADIPDLAGMVEPLLIVRRVLREQLGILHRRLLVIVQDDEVCRRLMTIPGVGPVVALTYRVTVDIPARFRNSKAVGAVLGLTPSKYQSGEINRTGAISKWKADIRRWCWALMNSRPYMSIGLLSMTPINSRSVISHMSCWSRTSSLALELEEKPLDSRSSQMASNSTASSSSLMRVGQSDGTGGVVRARGRATQLPLGTVSWNVSSNFPARPQLI